MTEGLTVTPEALQEKLDAINEIDSKLDAASGSTASVERNVRETLKNDTSETWDTFVSQIVDNLNNLSAEEQVGTVLAIQDTIDNTFKKVVKETLESRVESAKDELANFELDEAEEQELLEERKTLVQQFKALENILEMFGMEEEIAAIGQPKSRRGSRGKRGPRTLSKFQYTVNETELPEESNSLSMVAKMCGGIKVKELKDYIEAQFEEEDFLKNPPEEWKAELPNNVGTLYASKFEQYRGEDDESDDTESDDE